MVLGTGRRAQEELQLCSRVEADPLLGAQGHCLVCTHQLCRNNAWGMLTTRAHPAWIQACGYIPGRLSGHLSNQSLGGRGTGSLVLSLSGELSRGWVCRSSPKVRWWCFQANMVAYLQALSVYFYLPGASDPELNQISCDA